jgi:hypothetical protein
MHMEALKYKDRWITVEATAETGSWTYRIDGGKFRKFSVATAKPKERLFDEAISLAKAEIDGAANPEKQD